MMVENFEIGHMGGIRVCVIVAGRAEISRRTVRLQDEVPIGQ